MRIWGQGVWGKWIWRSGCCAECRGFGAGRSEEVEWEESAAPDNPLCYTPNGNSRSRPCLGAHRRTSRGSVGTKIQGQIERENERCVYLMSALRHAADTVTLILCILVLTHSNLVHFFQFRIHKCLKSSKVQESYTELLKHIVIIKYTWWGLVRGIRTQQGCLFSSPVGGNLYSLRLRQKAIQVYH